MIKKIVFVFCVVGFLLTMNFTINQITSNRKKIENLISNICTQGYDYFGIQTLAEEGIEDPDERTKELLKASIEKLNNIDQIEKFKDSIPLIIHYVYVTSKTNPKPISEENIEKVISNFKNLESEHSGWKVFFWTNYEKIIPEKIKNLENFVIKNINELDDEPLYKKANEFTIKGSVDKLFYAVASDIIRMIAVYKYGGLYLDLDYTIYQPSKLVKFLRAYDFLGGVQTMTPYPVGNNAFFAAKANHDILKTVISMQKRNLFNENIPNYVKYPYSRLVSVLFRTGPALFTTAIYKSANIENDIYFPSRILFNMNQRDIPQDQAIKRNYESTFYIEQPMGDDSFSGSWVTNNDFKNICYINSRNF